MTCFTRFHADLCGKVTVGLLLAAVFSPATARAQTQGDTSWQGAWHWIHESNDGRLILLEDWFCGVFGRKDRTVPPPGELSESQAAELFRSTAGPMCGPVLVSSTVEDPIILETVSRIAARPRNHGSRAIRPTRVEGSKMYSDLLRADGSVSVTWNYNRLDAPGTSPLAGVWELDSDSWEGIMLITDTQYRYGKRPGERGTQRPGADQHTLHSASAPTSVASRMLPGVMRTVRYALSWKKGSAVALHAERCPKRPLPHRA